MEHYIFVGVQLTGQNKIQLPIMQHESDKYGKWHQHFHTNKSENTSKIDPES